MGTESESVSTLTWRERCVIRVLMLVARILAGESQLALEIKQLTAHIEYGERP